MKKTISLLLALLLCFSMAGCTAKETETETVCSHEFESSVEGNTVTLTCKLCGLSASAEVELPTETVEVVKEVEVEKEVVKTIVKEVEKEVVVEKEVPVYATAEEKMNAEYYALLFYYMSNYQKLDFLKDYVTENYYTDVDEDALMEGAYKGMVEALNDPYSKYVPASGSEEYSNSLSIAYSGIGITMYADDDNNPRIESVNANGPAAAAGILAGDVIESADGYNLIGTGLDYAAGYIRGETGTSVEIGIIRDGEHLTFTVVRQQIAQSTVDYGYFLSGYGYISISGFNATTASELSAVLDEFENQGVQKFILDLRGNGGGNVDAALDTADLLMGEGVMTYVQDRNGNTEYYRTTAGRTSMKYVVLCDENSASATEMLCAAIQDNKEGILVGTTTFGKGIVQVYTELTDGSMINLTEYQYFSPSGKAIHKIGVTPDYVVEFTDDCFDENGDLISDIQLDKALDVLAEY